jgi:hypothetical protein
MVVSLTAIRECFTVLFALTRNESKFIGCMIFITRCQGLVDALRAWGTSALSAYCSRVGSIGHSRGPLIYAKTKVEWTTEWWAMPVSPTFRVAAPWVALRGPPFPSTAAETKETALSKTRQLAKGRRSPTPLGWPS